MSPSQVCREFRRGFCTRNVTECRFAHPSDNVNISEDGSVTICMDHEKGRCARDPCRYFHRPDHMKTTSSSSNKSTQNSLHSSVTNTFNIHPPGGGSTSAAQQQQIAYQQQIAVAALQAASATGGGGGSGAGGGAATPTNSSAGPNSNSLLV